MLSKPTEMLRLSAFWFGIQAVWGAVLGVILQARLVALLGAAAPPSYALLAASGAAVAILAQILAGMRADRDQAVQRSRAPLYLIGIGLACIALPLLLLLQSVIGLLLAYGLLQIGMNLAIAPYQAAIPEYLAGAQRRAGSAWLAGMQSLGNAAGATMAALLSGPVVAVLLPLLLAASFAPGSGLLTRPPSSPRTTRAFRLERAHLDLFGSRALIFLAFYTLLGYLYFWVLGASLEGLGAPRRIAGGAIVLFTIAGAIGATIAGRFAARGDARVLAAIGAGLFAGALALLFVEKGGATLLLASLIGGIGWGLFLSADWSIGVNAVPEQARATALGVWNLAVVLPQFFAPLLVGALGRALGLSGDRSLSHLAFGIACLELFVGILWLARLPAVWAKELRQAPTR